MNQRNRLCSCGSGKKFKRCCGDNAKLTLQRHNQRLEFAAQVQERSRERERETVKAIRDGKLPPIAFLATAAMLIGGRR